MMQDTSLLAYASILPTLGKRQKQVYNMLVRARTPLTNAELSAYLNWPINCVTGRCHELVKAGIVEEKGRKRDKWSGRLSIMWGVCKREQLEMF